MSPMIKLALAFAAGYALRHYMGAPFSAPAPAPAPTV